MPDKNSPKHRQRIPHKVATVALAGTLVTGIVPTQALAEAGQEAQALAQAVEDVQEEAGATEGAAGVDSAAAAADDAPVEPEPAPAADEPSEPATEVAESEDTPDQASEPIAEVPVDESAAPAKAPAYAPQATQVEGLSLASDQGVGGSANEYGTAIRASFDGDETVQGYSWTRDDGIEVGTGSSYTPGKQDVGHIITCTATLDGGKTSVVQTPAINRRAVSLKNVRACTVYTNESIYTGPKEHNGYFEFYPSSVLYDGIDGLIAGDVLEATFPNAYMQYAPVGSGVPMRADVYMKGSDQRYYRLLRADGTFATNDWGWVTSNSGTIFPREVSLTWPQGNTFAYDGGEKTYTYTTVNTNDRQTVNYEGESRELVAPSIDVSAIPVVANGTSSAALPSSWSDEGAYTVAASIAVDEAFNYTIAGEPQEGRTWTITGPAKATGTVAVTGTAAYGDTLTASFAPNFDPAGCTFTYHWQRSTDGGATWQTIEGEKGTSYRIAAADLNVQVRAVVTVEGESYMTVDGVDGGIASSPVSPSGASELSESDAGTVTVANPTREIGVQYGDTLQAYYTPAGDMTLDVIQWYREKDGVLEPIEGATGETYTLGKEDIDYLVYASAMVRGSEVAGYVRDRASTTVKKRDVTIQGVRAVRFYVPGEKYFSEAAITNWGTVDGKIEGDDVAPRTQRGANRWYFDDGVDKAWLEDAGVDIGVTATLDGKEVGAHTATASLTGNAASNFEIFQGETQQWSITPKKVAVEWDNTSLTYTGKPQAPQAKLAASAIIGDDEVHLVVSGERTNAGDDYTATARLEGDQAGNYQIEEGMSTTTFRIDPARARGRLNVIKDDTTYGETLEISYDPAEGEDDTVLAGMACKWYRNNKLIEGATGLTYTLTAADVGAHISGELIFSGNYERTIPFAFGKAVSRRTVTASGTTVASKVYDGTTGATVSNAGTLEGVLEQDAGSVELVATAQFANKNAGVGKEASVSYRLEGEHASCYLLESYEATVTADIAPLKVAMQWSNAHFTYNGLEQTHSCTFPLDQLVDGDDVPGITLHSYKGNNLDQTVSMVDAGFYRVKATIDDPNYAPTTFTEWRSVTINPREAQVVWSSTELTYNGESQAPIATLAEGSLVGKDVGKSVAFDVVGAQKNVGTYNNGASLQNLTLDGEETKNYTVTNAQQSFVINPKPVEVAWGETNLTYTGRPQVPEATLVAAQTRPRGVRRAPGISTAGVIIDSEEAYLVVSGAQKDAGTWTATAALAGAQAGNYRIVAGSSTQKFTIVPAHANGTVGITGEAVYGETLTASYRAAAGEDDSVYDEISYLWLRDGMPIDSATESTYTLTADDIEHKISCRLSIAGNYAGILETYQTAAVARRTVTVTGTVVADKVYDGTTGATVLNVGVLSNVLAQDAGSVTLRASADFADKNTGTAKDVEVDYWLEGDLERLYQLESPVGTTTANISPLELSVQWADTQLTYDGTPQAPSATLVATDPAHPIVAADKISVSVAGAAVDAGTYSARASLTGDVAGNYRITNGADREFTIGKAPVALAAELRNATTLDEAKDFTYGDRILVTGTVQNASALAAGGTDGMVALFSGETQLSDWQDISGDGSYAIELDTAKRTIPPALGKEILVRFTSRNFEDGETALLLNLHKRKVTATVTGSFGKAYDGTTAAPYADGLVTVNGLLEGDSASVTWTGSYDGANAGRHRVTLTNLTLDQVSSEFYELETASLEAEGTISAVTASSAARAGTSAARPGAKIPQTGDASSLAGSIGFLGALMSAFSLRLRRSRRDEE